MGYTASGMESQAGTQSAGALVRLGHLAAERGDLAQALECYRHALRIAPDTADAHFGIGSVFYRQGDGVRAVAAWREALRLDPEHPKAGRWLALVGPTFTAEPHERTAIRLSAAHQEDGAAAAATVWDAGEETSLVFDAEPAPARLRLAALVVDSVVVVLLSLAGALVITSFRHEGPLGSPIELLTPETGLWAVIVFAVLGSLYSAWWHGSAGRTPGKALFALAVVRQDGEPLGAVPALLRLAGLWVNVLLMGVPYFLALRGPAGAQGWHDRWAGSRVVRTAARGRPLWGVVYTTPALLFLLLLCGSLVLVPNAINARRRAELYRTRTDLSEIGAALASFRAVHGRFPAALHELTTPIAYLPRVPHDPFSLNPQETYAYAIHPSQTYWLLIARGPDRVFALDARELVAQAVRPADLYELVKDHLYNPDMGLLSDGDIVEWGGPTPDEGTATRPNAARPSAR